MLYLLITLVSFTIIFGNLNREQEDCMFGTNILGHKKVKTHETKKAVCLECGRYYDDKASLEKHINWAHPWVIYNRQQF